MRSDDQPIPEEAVGFNFHFQIANGAGRKACSVRVQAHNFHDARGFFHQNWPTIELMARIVDLGCRRGGDQPHDATLVAISTQRETIDWRADTSPQALLGVRLVNVPRANPSPGTSLEHAFEIVMPGRR